MRRQRRRLEWVLAALAPSLAFTAAHGKGVQPRIEKLDNGLELILVERHETPTVAAMVAYDVGSVNDPRGQSGIAHLFEHMLFKGSTVIGTTDYQAEKKLIEEEEKLRIQMNDEMNKMRELKRYGRMTDVLDPAQWSPEYGAMKKNFDELVVKHREFIKNNELFNLYTTNGGAGLNAGTSADFTVYYVQVPANKIELFFWLESDRMFNGIMREFYVERDNVREERRLRTESAPTGKLDESFEALFWQAHPYGVPTLGWASEVESITSQDVRDFYKIYYAPNNAKVVLVGDFDSDKIVDLAKRYFGRIPRGTTPPTPVIIEEPRPIAERRLNGEADTNPRVSVRFHTVALAHTDEAALNVAAQLLSGKTGRLYKRLVTKEEAVLGQPFAANKGRKYAGSFEINVTIKEGKEPEAVESMILEEIEKLRDDEITDHELQKVKNQIVAQSVQALRSNAALVFQLAIYDLWYDWTYINEAPERMTKVTADQVRRVLRKYLDPKTRTVAVYRTKAADPTDVDSPEFAAAMSGVPSDVQAQYRKQVAKIKESTDLDKLQDALQRVEQLLSSGQVPEDKQAVMNLMLNAMRSRVAELKAPKKETK